MHKFLRSMLGLAAFSCTLAGTPAMADSFTFDFNSLSAGATNISSYMTSYLTSHGCIGCSVVVTGGVADKDYDGDNHVTGPGSTGAATSLTLGTSDGATASNWNSPINATKDTFIANTDDSGHQVSSQIVMKFYGLTINGTISFDYEIFPDATCRKLTASRCGGSAVGGIYPNQPDFKFKAGAIGAAAPVLAFGTGGTQYGVTPGSSNGNATHSQIAGTELTPQYIGHFDGTLANVTELDFIDWPATIGIDNLVITTTPEPGAFVLFGTVIAGVLLLKRKKAAIQG